MPLRATSLLAAAAFAGFAMSAQAQDAAPLPPPAHLADAGTYEGEWVGQWEDPGTYRGIWNGTYTGIDGEPVEAQFRGTFLGDGYFLADDGRALQRDERHGWHEDRYRDPRGARRLHHGQAGPGDGRPLGYTPQQRAAWLDQCRASYLRSDYRNGNGAVIGGLVGAAVGGFAGNRIADGNRLLGTVVGAGVGGLAGAAIGDAADRDARRDGEAAAIDQCENYLRRYEASYAAPGYSHAPGYGPVQWVRVPIIREHRRDCDCRKIEAEEVIEEVVEQPIPTKYVPVKQPTATKLLPVKTQKIQ